MKNNTKQIVIGGLLVLAGIIFLIQQIFHLSLGGLFVSLFFAAGGAAFLYVVLRKHENWWAFIPGFTLLGLAVLIASAELLPSVANQFGGSIFLGAVALGFVAILIVKPSHWWAVIPAGALATLALIAGIPGGNGMIQGGLFFAGIGATFAAVGLMPVGRNEKWPWIPAGICFVIGTLIMLGSGAFVDSVMGWIWAVGFLLVGGYLVVRSFIKKE